MRQEKLGLRANAAPHIGESLLRTQILLPLTRNEHISRLSIIILPISEWEEEPARNTTL